MKRKQEERKKFYVYVDESGQETKGLIFIVSVLILEEQREIIGKELEKIEIDSKKRNSKWTKSRNEYRKKYIEKITQLTLLKNRIFFDMFSDSKKYLELTSYATAKAILKKSDSDYKATIFIDGMRKKELEVFRKGLRDLRIRVRKIRGVKKDENNAFIRLVDSICGLIRDAENKNNLWAKETLSKLKKKNIVTEL